MIGKQQFKYKIGDKNYDKGTHLPIASRCFTSVHRIVIYKVFYKTPIELGDDSIGWLPSYMCRMLLDSLRKSLRHFDDIDI